jgi:hypothetical protein
MDSVDASPNWKGAMIWAGEQQATAGEPSASSALTSELRR